eukprot:CFRG7724T1
MVAKKSGKGGAMKPKSVKKPMQGLTAEMYDDIEQFHNSKDRVMFGGDTSNDDVDAEYANDEEAVLDLDGESDSDSQEDDAEGSDSESDDDNEDEADIETLKNWGKKKKSYYGADFVDEELGSDFDAGDFEDAEEEEVEALRLQRAQAELLNDADFLGDSMVETMAKAGNQTDNEQQKEANDNLSIVNKVTGELDNIELDSSTRVMRDTSGLTREEKLELLLHDSPEIIELTGDLQDAILELRTRIAPVRRLFLERSEDTERTPQAIAAARYMDIRFHLLVNYCMNLSFYLYLKANGENVRDHPVINQVVKLRDLKEKMDPVNESVQQQLDFLSAYLRSGESDESSDSEENIDSENEGASTNGHENAVYTQSIMQDNESESDEIHERLHASRKPTVKSKSESKTVSGFIVAPTKVTTEEVMYASEMARKVKNRMDIKSNKAGSKRLASGGDYGESESAALGRATGQIYKSALHKHHEKQKQKGPKKWESLGGDDDVPMRKRDSRIQYARDDEVSNDGNAIDLEIVDHNNSGSVSTNSVVGSLPMATGAVDDDDADMDYYQELVAMKKKRKDTREQEHVRVADYLPEEEAEEKRGVNWQIQKNKGLTPKRQIRNPRVKHKLKYGKAMTKRKHVVKTYKVGASGKTYGGESTGVKSGLSRSVKL